MNENELNLALSNLRWGTGMPITVITTSGIEQVRCRGSYSIRVKDFIKLQEKIPQVEQTAAWAGSMVVTKVNDTIGEIAPELTSARQLTDKLDEINKKVANSIKANLESIGVDLINFSVEAIDIL